MDTKLLWLHATPVLLESCPLVDHQQHRAGRLWIRQRSPGPAAALLRSQSIRKVHQGSIGSPLVHHHLSGVEMQRWLHRSHHRQWFTRALFTDHLLRDLTNRELSKLIPQFSDGHQRREMEQQQRHLHGQQTDNTVTTGQQQSEQPGEREPSSRTEHESAGQQIHRQCWHLWIIDQWNPQG